MDTKYGYCGNAAKWDVGDIHMKGSAGQDFHVGELVMWPNQCGFFERNNNWYTYEIDERNFCIFSGPFSSDGIIYACAMVLHMAERFEEYSVSEEELHAFLHSHFRSFDEIDSFTK